MYKKEYNLGSLNTFGLPVSAQRYFEFHDVSELREYMVTESFQGEQYFVLGGGSNVLFVNDFSGTILHPTGKRIEVIESSAGKVKVRVDSGVNWDDFVAYTVSKGWRGIENLTLVPGNVGASPVQNIGAYGTEVSEVVYAVNCFDLQLKKEVVFTSSDLAFSYRWSALKEKQDIAVLSVEFLLTTRDEPGFFKNGLIHGLAAWSTQALALMYMAMRSVRIGAATGWKLKMNFAYVRDILSLSILPPKVKRSIVKAIREKTMPNPHDIGNVGCFFKSPIVKKSVYERIKLIDESICAYPCPGEQMKLSAGDLIKSCGWAGKRIGDVGVQRNRPLIILNYGCATGEDIFSFSSKIQEDIHVKFHVKVEPEVVILGAGQ